jgi:hypothetical protein
MSSQFARLFATRNHHITVRFDGVFHCLARRIFAYTISLPNHASRPARVCFALFVRVTAGATNERQQTDTAQMTVDTMLQGVLIEGMAGASSRDNAAIR